MEERKDYGSTEILNSKKAPSSITVNVRPRVTFDDVQYKKNRGIPKGLLAALVTVGSLLVIGVIVVGVLLITQPKAAAAIDTVPAVSDAAEPEATPSATPEPTPSATPVPTTPPEESDDLSSIFEAPTNPILEESQGQ